MRYISPPKETPLGWQKVAGYDYVFDKTVNCIDCRLVFIFIDNESGFYQVYVDTNRPHTFYSIDKVNSFCEKETTKINKSVDYSFKFVKTVTLEIFEFSGEEYCYMNNTWYYFVGDNLVLIEDYKIDSSLNRLHKAWMNVSDLV